MASKGRGVQATALGMALGALVALPASPADARVVGPDLSGYRVVGPEDAGAPAFAWEDAEGSTPVLQDADDEAAVVTVPFPVALLGQESTELSVSSNGYVAGGPGDVSVPDPESAAQRRLVAYGADLVSSTVTREVAGAAGHRRMFLTWSAQTAGGEPVLMQMVLAEDTTDVLVRYSEIASAALDAPGRVALVGPSTPALVWSSDGHELADTSAVVFTQDRVMRGDLGSHVLPGGYGRIVVMHTPNGSRPVTLSLRLEGPEGLSASHLSSVVSTQSGYLSMVAFTDMAPGVVTGSASFTLPPDQDAVVALMLGSGAPTGDLTVGARLSGDGLLVRSVEHSQIGADGVVPPKPQCTATPRSHGGLVSTVAPGGPYGITHTTITAHPQDAQDDSEDVVVVATASPWELSGLVNRRTYDVTVVATNGVGDSAPGSCELTPSDVPAAPLATAEPVDRAVLVHFTMADDPEAEPAWYFRADLESTPAADDLETINVDNSGALYVPLAVGTHVLRFRACNAVGCGSWGAWTEPLEVTVLPPDRVEMYGVMDNEGDLHVLRQYAESLSPVPFCLNQELYEGADPDTGVLLAGQYHGQWGTSIEDVDLVPGTTYSVRTWFCDAATGAQGPAVDLTLGTGTITPEWSYLEVEPKTYVVIPGTVAAPAGPPDEQRRVRLWSRPVGVDEWTFEGLVTVAPDGSFAASARRTDVSTEYRLGFSGTVDTIGDRRTVTVGVRPELTAELTDTTISRPLARALPGSTKLFGTAYKGLAGETVRLQRLVDGSWKNAGATRTLAKQTLPNGSKAVGYVFRLDPTKAGKYAYRVQFSGSDAFAKVTTKKVVLTVR